MKTGIYVDASNAEHNGGFHMRYEVLRAFGQLESGRILRANTYIAVDRERMQMDPAYAEGRAGFMWTVRRNGFKVVEKPVQRFVADDGTVTVKANADLDMAVDVLVQSNYLDRIVLVTGDGDFARVVTALQNHGCRVTVIGFRNVSRRLREEADVYHSGFLVPGLVLPQGDESRLTRRRGYVQHYKVDRQYGYMSYLDVIANELVEETVWFHRRSVEERVRDHHLVVSEPDRRAIFEFALTRSGTHFGKNEAAEITLAEESVVV